MNRTRHIWLTATLCASAVMAISWLTACSTKDDSMPESYTSAKGLSVSITASFGEEAPSATRAVSFGDNGTSSNSTFAEGDKIYIYNTTRGTLETNYLTVSDISTDGKTATFGGTLAKTYEAGDALTLYYNLSRFGSYSSCYLEYATKQKGSKTTASQCDYATADATVSTVLNGTLTTTAAVTLQKMQSQVCQRLTFKNSGGSTVDIPDITSLKIACSSNKLSQRYWLEDGDFTNPITISNPSIDAHGDIYLALRFASGSTSSDALTLTATDADGNVYEGTKSVPSTGFQNGKYYHGGMMLTWARQLVRPSVTWISPSTPVEPDEYNRYDVYGIDDIIDITIGGTSKGYYFFLNGSSGTKTVTLDDLDATYGENGQYIYSVGSLTLNISGSSSISCKKSQAIFASGTLKLSGKGKLTVTTTSNSRYGIYGSSNYNDDNNSDASVLAADGYYVTRSEQINNGDGTYTCTYTVTDHMPKTYTLSAITDDITLEDGDTMTGKLSGNYKITVADGATVTLSGVDITCLDDNKKYAGITCPGDATLILVGTNTVKGGDRFYPGIHIAEDKTLTIKGDGKLTASSNGNAAGIGGGYGLSCGNIVIESGDITATGSGGAAGIGGGNEASWGNITIKGGTIRATGGYYTAGAADRAYGAPGIGSGIRKAGRRGNITIEGGNVTATGADYAPGIGSGGFVNGNITYDQAFCGNITISGGTVVAQGGKESAAIGGGRNGWTGKITIRNTVTSVTATKGSGAYNSIGASAGGGISYGVTIEDGANVTQN